ncbi:DUF4267 domain-containing protein [Nocardia yamanashiensis]|uniref:DUF4267 domain-containing protein n=1 Tax=Nocardia yamanashiensis TaxID=209247 RepID=UPI001E41EBCC|nr:DUF4267 domain-containing protein [Nocardia yamanashiensis]UGT44606.1 DUF4267 domain-containing protein [Nocardia yamanashiensis]
MQSIIGYALAALIALAVFVMGSSFFWAPQGAAGFGIPGSPIQDPAFRAWLRVKGVRDMACAVGILVPLAAGATTLLGGLLLALALIPLGDAAIVLRSKGPKSAAYGVHAGSAAVMLVAAALLLTIGS